MASVFRKTVTKTLPANSEIVTRKGERISRWKDRRGKTRTASLTIGRDGSERIVIVCAMWLTGFDVPSLSTIYLDKPLKPTR